MSVNPQLLPIEKFEELLDFLDSEEGCNFHERIPGDSKSVTWKCDGTLAMTLIWMETHGITNGIEQAINLAEIQRHGGHCDCEVLFNVSVEDWLEKVR